MAPPLSRWGEEGFSSCSTCPRHRAVALTPPECPAASARCDGPCGLRLSTVRLGLRGSSISGPPVRSLSLRPGDSLTLLPRAWSVGFRVSVSLHPATRVTGLWLLPRRVCLPLNTSAFSGRTVDHELELRGLLDGKVGGLGALEDPGPGSLRPAWRRPGAALPHESGPKSGRRRNRYRSARATCSSMSCRVASGTPVRSATSRLDPGVRAGPREPRLETCPGPGRVFPSTLASASTRARAPRWELDLVCVSVTGWGGRGRRRMARGRQRGSLAHRVAAGRASDRAPRLARGRHAPRRFYAHFCHPPTVHTAMGAPKKGIPDTARGVGMTCIGQLRSHGHRVSAPRALHRRRPELTGDRQLHPRGVWV
jgi:hypothetical protein